MADHCCEYSYAGIVINDDTTDIDRLMIDEDGEVTGLDGAPVRSQVDPQGQSDGGIVHPKFFGPRVITFQGQTHIQSASYDDITAYLTALNTLENTVIGLLEAQLNSAATLSWTPTGIAAQSISASYGVPGQEIQFSGSPQPGNRRFSFSLIAAEPTIAGA